MKSAEEILQPSLQKVYGENVVVEKEAIKAMQEFAKQEVRQEVRKVVLEIDDFISNSETDLEVRMKARELDEKDFEQYMYDKFWKPLSDIIHKNNKS